MRTFERVCVLGSNSFTGAHMVNYLLAASDCQILGVSRSPQVGSLFAPYHSHPQWASRFRFEQLDLNQDFPRLVELLDAFRPQAVINYSAQGEVRNSWTWPHQWYETNVQGVVRLVEYLVQSQYTSCYLAASTPEVYGSTGCEPVRENHNYQPSTPYGVSKLGGDLHLLARFRKDGFPAILTRAANLYGIHQQLYRIIPRTALYMLAGKTLTLHGGGKARRAFIHARDVASGTYLAMTRGRLGEVYHLAPEGELFSIAQVVDVVCAGLGGSFQHLIERQADNYGQDEVFSLDASKARHELGWEPRVAFQEGVEETVGWVRSNYAALSQLPWDYVHKA